MLSTMYGKVEKAIRYAQEPERITFNDFQVTIHGDHRNHVVTFSRGSWNCDCETFDQHDYCPHTMAMERVLGGMLGEAVPATD